MAKVNYLSVKGYHTSSACYKSASRIPIYDSLNDVSGQKYINVQLTDKVGYIPLIETSNELASRVKVQWSDGNAYALKRDKKIEASDITRIEFRATQANLPEGNGWTLSSYTITDTRITITSTSKTRGCYIFGHLYVILNDGTEIDVSNHDREFCRYFYPLTVNMTNKLTFNSSGCGYYFNFFDNIFDYGDLSGSSFTFKSSSTLQNTLDEGSYYDGYFQVGNQGYLTTSCTLNSVLYNDVSIPFKFVNAITTSYDNSNKVSTLDENSIVGLGDGICMKQDIKHVNKKDKDELK